MGHSYPASCKVVPEHRTRFIVVLSTTTPVAQAGMTSTFDRIRSTLGQAYEPLHWLPRGVGGEWLCLARDRSTGELVVLSFDPGWADGKPGAPSPGVLRALPAVVGSPWDGPAVSGDDPATGGLSRSQLMDAVRNGSTGTYDLLGDVPRVSDAGLVYFARMNTDGALYALRLAPERQPDGSDEFVLAAQGVLPGEPPAAAASPAPAPSQSSKVCPQCEATYPADVRFCPVDGATLVSVASGDDLIGQVVADRYHVERLLGEGGMGRVYLAEHVRMGRRSAVKVMGRALTTDREALSRFNREASNASRISHTHVAAVYDFGETRDGLVYLAMEYVDGEPLTNLLRREARLDPARAARIVAQVGDGLDAAHALGIVHRDLKPDNIMITRDRDGGDWVKIVDFGIAKEAGGGEGQQVTKTGLVIGTPEYMSPEQLAGEGVDARSDVYSLALVAFVLLAGELPFAGGSTEQIFMSRLAGKPRTLAEVHPGTAWPASVQAVFDRALARDPAHRPGSAGELGMALLGAVRDGFGLSTAAMALPRGLTPPRGTSGAAASPMPPTQVAGASDAGGTRQHGGKGGEATPSGGRSKAPALAAVALVGILVLGGGAWMMLRGSGTDGESQTAVTPAAAAVDSAGPGSAGGAAPENPADEPGIQAELAQIAEWTDVVQGDRASAQRAVDQIPLLLPRLTTAVDSVEAAYYAAQASYLLDDMEGTCRQARALVPRAEAVGFLVEAVRAMASACP